MESNESTEGMRRQLLREDLTGKIIAAAIAVHKQLGPGFVETIYEQGLKIELARQGMGFEAQKPVKVWYGGEQIGTHVLDLMVEEEVVVELKAVKALDDVHYAQLRSYLRATGAKVGLLINFNSSTLVVKRVVN